MPRRLAAYVLDCVVLFGGLLVLQALLYPVNPIVRMIRGGESVAPGQLHVWVTATATLPFLLYFAWGASSAARATIGMRWLRLRVEQINGERVAFGRALVRSAVLLVPFEANHVVMFNLAPQNGSPATAFYVGIVLVWLLIGVYLASMVASPLGQSVHDRVAGTVVRAMR